MKLKCSWSLMEKLLFPLFLFCFEFIFLVIFGLLVEYDDAGAPDQELAAALRAANSGDTGGFVLDLESSLSTTKTYPCESS